MWGILRVFDDMGSKGVGVFNDMEEGFGELWEHFRSFLLIERGGRYREGNLRGIGR